MPWYLVAALLLPFSLLAAPPAGSTSDTPAAKTVDEVLACLRENAPESTMRQRMELKVFDRTGDVQTMKAKLWWKRSKEDRSKLLIRLQAPPDLRGSSFLLIEQKNANDMYAYLPELKKVRRVTGRSASGSVFGSDFSYEDMEHLFQMAVTGKSKRVDDEEVSGRNTWVIESIPDETDESAYSRSLSFIDQQTCVMIKGTFYSPDGEVRKSLVADVDSLEREDEVWIPKFVRIEDFRTATHSELRVGKVDFDIEISDSKFTKSALERGN